MGDNAVAGCEHVGKVGVHLAIDRDGPFDADLGTGGRSKFGIGANPHHDKDHVDTEADYTTCSGCVTCSRPLAPWGARLIVPHRRAGVHVHTVLGELFVHEGPELSV